MPPSCCSFCISNSYFAHTDYSLSDSVTTVNSNCHVNFLQVSFHLSQIPHQVVQLTMRLFIVFCRYFWRYSPHTLALSCAAEKAGQIDDMTRWNPDNPIRLVTGEGGFKHNRVYNRPVYVQRNLSGEPYDLRKYDIRQKITVAPSTAPSAWPTRNPTYHPTATPNKQPASNSSPETIPAISLGATYPPTVLLESDGIWDDDVSDMFKEEPVHQENQYEENVPDFADWDDFFEMPELHDLTDFMEKYAVILAFTGSRYYGTMISPDSEFDDLFPEDYHAFWDDSFSLKRTFIISDTTFASSPAGKIVCRLM